MSQTLNVEIKIPEEYVLVNKEELIDLRINQTAAIWDMNDLKKHLKIKSDSVICKKLLYNLKFRERLDELGIVHQPNEDFNRWRFKGPDMYRFILENYEEILKG